MFIRILARIENRFFRRGKVETEQLSETATKLLQENLEDIRDGEVVQSISTMDMVEQLHIIQTVKDYMKNYVTPVTQTDSAWISGYALQNELFVTKGDDTLYRCNMEVFFQEKESGHRKLDFRVSLVKFHGDSWRILKFKEKSMEVIFANV
jgi:hypothetical protein